VVHNELYAQPETLYAGVVREAVVVGLHAFKSWAIMFKNG
jgi:hypothetical protein